MNRYENRLTILMADDDAEDFFLLKEGLEECQLDCDLRHVPDGKELVNYLLRQDKYINHEQAPRPLFILLDLNMPGKKGQDVLMEIKSIPELKHIPVIMYTASREEEDIRQCYASGANSYISKPGNWDQLINMIMTLFPYWIQTVRLPGVEFNTSAPRAA